MDSMLDIINNQGATAGNQIVDDGKTNNLQYELPKTLNNGEEKRPKASYCVFFKRGYCRKGDSCNFIHSSIRMNFSPHHRPDFSTNKNICRFFKRGFCRYGDRCRFYHEFNSTAVASHMDNLSLNSTLSVEKDCNEQSDSVRTIPVVETRLTDVNSTEMNNACPNVLSEDVNVLRNTEITQLKKRYPGHKIMTIDGIESFIFTFVPTDPDWPFDLKSLEMEAFFPPTYPQEVCRISVLNTNEIIPEMLESSLNNCIKLWLQKRHDDSKSELYFRPFLKWFDKNLEELFILGLRKAKRDILAKESGFEFVPFENIFPKNDNCNTENLTSENLNNTEQIIKREEPGIDFDFMKYAPDASNFCENEILMKNNTQSVAEKTTANNSMPENQGTKVTLTNLELTENAAVATCTRISSSVQCSRCKTSCSIVVASEKQIQHQCSKCHKPMGFMFRPSTLHQFSNVLGHLFLQDCQAVDVNLVECNFSVDCLNCSKKMVTNGIHFSQKHSTWCTYCNKKICIFIGGVKFTAPKSLYNFGKQDKLYFF